MPIVTRSVANSVANGEVKAVIEVNLLNSERNSLGPNVNLDE
jgi:hypothetical protein